MNNKIYNLGVAFIVSDKAASQKRSTTKICSTVYCWEEKTEINYTALCSIDCTGYSKPVQNTL